MYQLYNNDCFDILPTLSNESVDYSFTSPPYNRKRNDKYSNYDDTMKNYYEFLINFTEQLIRITKNIVIVNIQCTYYNKVDVYKYIGNYADKIQQIVVWEKSNPMPAGGYKITNAYEYFIMLSDNNITSNYTYTKNHITSSVNSDMSKIHKAVMKQEIADWFIDKFTKENETVIDPFMGLGTTGISCIKYNRNFIGIELDKTYFDVAKERLENEKYFNC